MVLLRLKSHKYDCDIIANAFDITEDMFRQTFRFKKGDWLLASYDAAGLEAIPIPIHLENAEDRVLNFVARLQPAAEAVQTSLLESWLG